MSDTGLFRVAARRPPCTVRGRGLRPHFADIYNSPILQVVIGVLSSVRWFAEWLVVSEDRTWPTQYGYSAPPYILDEWALGRNDRDSVKRPRRPGFGYMSDTSSGVKSVSRTNVLDPVGF